MGFRSMIVIVEQQRVLQTTGKFNSMANIIYKSNDHDVDPVVERWSVSVCQTITWDSWSKRPHSEIRLSSLCPVIELYGREHELRTIPLEPLVVLWFSQRPHRQWQTSARRFHSPTRAVYSASSTNTAARHKSWNSQSVAASTGFSRSKMLPRNPIWTSLTWVMWLFAHSESGFCIYCLEGSLVPFWWGLSRARLTPFVISIMTSPTVVPDTNVLFLATAW